MGDVRMSGGVGRERIGIKEGRGERMGKRKMGRR